MFEDVDEGHPDKPEDNKYTFYYNREHRLENAPQSVKDYYDGKMKPVTGIKIFVANRQNRYILLALVLFVSFAWMYSGFNKTRDTVTIDNNLYEVQAFTFEEEVYVSMKISPVKNSVEVKTPVNIQYTIQSINNDNQIFQTESDSILYNGGEKYIRTKFADYDIIRVDIDLRVDKTEKEISAFVKR